ncbi:hypothetical protein GCM10028772_15350 [Nocardioides ultimimeridianus]
MRWWLGATLVLTIAPFVAAVALAPPPGARPGSALVWLLFVGSSTHVGATAWFYTVPEVRGHIRRHRSRYVVVPVLLVLGTAAAAVVTPSAWFLDALLGYFGWQFLHFQKQNLGIAALAARSLRLPGLTQIERRALIGAGCGGILALVGHPALLQLAPDLVVPGLFSAGAVVFAASVAVGVAAVWRRPPGARSPAFVAVYAVSLLFFAPVFAFSSPYAAVAGLTIAHGLQYLLLLGMLAGAPVESATGPQLGVLLLVNGALVAGLLLNQASHLHTAHGLPRAIYGAYLGLVMAHFVVDAGLWRLRDEFPRAFLGRRLPYLLGR